MACDLTDVIEHVIRERQDGLLQLLVVWNDRPAHQQGSRVVVTFVLTGQVQVPNQPPANVAPGLCEAQGAKGLLVSTSAGLCRHS